MNDGPEPDDWLRLIYPGDVTGGNGRARPDLAVRLLADHPRLALDDHVAGALGDEARIRQLIAADPAWANRPGGPLRLPPLIAVTHSSLAHDARYRDRLRRCVQILLEAGADPNQSIGHRFPPH